MKGTLKQRFPNAGKDLPQCLALLRAQTVLPAHAGHVRLGLGAVDMPGVDHVLLGKREARGEAGDN